MKCLNCGRELSPTAKFCAGCGCATENAFEAQTLRTRQSAADMPVTEAVIPGTVPMTAGHPTPETVPMTAGYFVPGPDAAAAPDGKKAKKKMGVGKKIALGIGCAVAAVGVVAGSIFLVKVLSPKGRLVAAFDKSLSAFREVKVGVFNAELSEEVAAGEKYSMDLAVELTGGDEIPYMLRGVGVNYAQDINKDAREAGFSAGVVYGGMEVIDAQLLVDDNEIYVGVEEILGEGLYGVDTETIGKDLVDMGVEDSTGMLEDVGFNLFELIEAVKEAAEPISKEEWTAILTEFAGAVEVEKVGKKTMDINGNDVKCTQYSVVIPEDAMLDLAETVLESAGDVDYTHVVEVFLEEVGLPGFMADMLLEEMGMDLSDGQISTDEMMEAAEFAIENIGDLEFGVYISGGYIMAVTCEKEIEDATVNVGLYLGGGKTYVDDWSLVVEVEQDGEPITVELISSGDHLAKNGEYTDETVLRASYGEEDAVLLTSEVSYDCESDDDNFRWTLWVPEADAGIDMIGTMDNGGGQIHVDLDEVSVEYDGDELVSFAAEYRLGEYDPDTDDEDKYLLFDMSMKELTALAGRVEENIAELAETLDRLGIEF